MKTILKRSFTLLLALVLVAMSAVSSNTAYASQAKGGIKIKDSVEGEVYRLYRILGLTNSGWPERGTSYHLTEEWEDFFVGGKGSNYVSDTKGDLENTIAMPDGSVKYIAITEDNVHEFANDSFEYAAKKDPTIEVIGTGEDMEINVDSLGYYLLYPVGTGEIKDGHKTIFSLQSTSPFVEIDVKSDKPSIEKKPDKDKLDIGDTVVYTITGTVPDTRGFEKYTYIIKDELSEGLSLDKESIEVKIGGEVLSEGQFTITFESDHKFEISIDMKDFSDKIGEVLEVKYSATLNEKAVSGSEGNGNKAILEYSNDPKDENSTVKTPEEEILVYTQDIEITKVDGKNPEIKLEGAEFILKNEDGKYYNISETGDKVTWVEESEATKVLSDENGIATFKGLKDGKYILIESKAPDGYNDLKIEEDIIVNEKDNENIKLDIENNAGTELPGTGGMGTRIFTVIGGALIVIAGYSLLKGKSGKKDSEE